MSAPSRTRLARKPSDPRARERLREAQLAETRALAAVCAAEARVERAATKRDRAVEFANYLVAQSQAGLDQARAELAAVSGAERAALLLGIGKTELRRSLASASGQDGAA